MSRLGEFSSIFYITKEIYENEKVTLTRKNSKKSKSQNEANFISLLYA